MTVSFGEKIREMSLRVNQARQRMVRPRFDAIGLALGMPRILHFLSQRGSVTQRELADYCMQDPAAMSRNLDRLEQMGYLTRQPDPDSRRACRVTLTALGEQKVQEVNQVYQEIEAEMSAGFSPTEAEELLRGMEKLLHNLEAGNRKI